MHRHILSFGAAAGALLLAVALAPQQASALPGTTVAGAHVKTDLVQQVGSKRRYYRDHGDYVRAPIHRGRYPPRDLGRGALRAGLFGTAWHLGAGAVRQSVGAALVANPSCCFLMAGLVPAIFASASQRS